MKKPKIIGRMQFGPLTWDVEVPEHTMEWLITYSHSVFGQDTRLLTLCFQIQEEYAHQSETEIIHLYTLSTVNGKSLSKLE